MIETLKKTIFAGIGAAALTKEAVEKVLNDWVEKGKISAADAKEFFAKSEKVGEESWEKVCGGISEKTEDFSKKMPFATREQLCEINRRLKAIEEKLGIATPCECCGEKDDAASVPAETPEA